MNSNEEQQFLNELDKTLWNAADKLRSTLDAACKSCFILVDRTGIAKTGNTKFIETGKTGMLETFVTSPVFNEQGTNKAIA